MGDPRKRRKKYATPMHPWQGQRIIDENKLTKEYGLKNKIEIWGADSMVRNFRHQAKGLIGASGSTAETKTKGLIGKLTRLGILAKGAAIDDVLALTTRNILDRRLQSLVYKKGIAHTPKDARQMIVHGHITLKGEKHTAPGTLILEADEGKIVYIGSKARLEAPRPKRKRRAPVSEEAPTAPAEPAPEKKPAEEPKPEAAPAKPASEEKKPAEGPKSEAPAEEPAKKEEKKEESQ